MDNILYAIRIIKEGKIVGYVTDIGVWWYSPPIRNARLYRAKHFADIYCNRINSSYKDKNIKGEVIEVKLVTERKEDV